MSARFEGSSVLITGGSRGLGRALAVAFGREQAKVYVGYRVSGAEAEHTVATMVDEGGQGSALEIDVRDDDSVERAVAQVLQAEGSIEVLVNNAGVQQSELFALSDPAKSAQLLSVNLEGVLRCCRAVARPMIGRRAGSIVNIASVAALRATPGLSVYGATKGGVIAFTRSLGAELAPKGVRVNAVVPGFLTTGMGERMDAEAAERSRAAIACGRFGEPTEVSSAVLFLASAEASYIVGQALVVDGGLSL